MKEATWREYRRHLPHWRVEGATYFVTWRIHATQGELTPDERTLVVNALEHFHGVRYHLNAFVVMNDHVHVLLRIHDGWRLDETLHSWKSFTANRMQRVHRRTGAVWQGESFDRIVRDGAEFETQLAYILGNPAKRWPGLQEYPWVGCYPD